MKSWISSYHCIVLEVYQDSKVSSDTPQKKGITISTKVYQDSKVSSDTPLQKINSVYE